MTEKRTCEECGAELPANAPQGLCPRCLAKMGLGLLRTAVVSESDFQVERAGTMIGRYKLLEKIGEGGFGVVYMAEQVEPVQRKVALKIIKAGMDTKEVIARFEAERQAIALMDHPNIARALDAGSTEAGRPYFVMELVRGIPITEYCDRDHLSTPERLRLFIKVCQAVQHAHQKGVIHRDLKPSNVLVTEHDGEPVPKVIDFGVAKALGQRLTEKTLFTGFQHMLGTPAYMSPEQASLSGLDIDTRADIYSLGVLLYELLTGVTPFDADTFRKAALDEIQRMIRETEPPKPSTRLQTLGERLTDVAKRRQTEPGALGRLIRGDLDWIVMRCLEKDRRRRYETANGLAMDLQRHLGNEPVVARPPSNLYRFQKLVRRHRVPLSIAGLALALLLAGTVSTVVQMLRANRFAAQTQRTTAALGDSLYVSDMSLAHHAILDRNYGLAYRTLQSHRPRSGEPDRRTFEWRYLWRLCQDERLTMWLAHSNAVGSLAVSPDGFLLGSASYDHEAKLWDLRSGACLQVFPHTDSLAFAPEGDLIFAAGDHGQIEAWNARTMQKEFVFNAGTPSATERPTVRLAISPVASILAVSPDGTFFGGTGSISLYDYRSKRELGQLSNSGDRAAFSRDGSALVTGSAGERIHVWDVASRKETRSLGPIGGLSSLALSPDGHLLATTEFWHDYIRLWDLETGRELPSLRGHETFVWQVAFSPDGRLLASVSSDQTVRLWDMEKRQPIKRLVGHTSETWSVAFSPNLQRLYTGSKDQTISVWPTSFPPPNDSFRVINTRESPPLISKDGLFIAAVSGEGSSDGELVVRSMDTLEIRAVLKGERQALRFSKENSELMTLNEKSELGFWNLSAPALNHRVNLPKTLGRITRVVASEDSRWVAVLSDAKAGIWLVSADSGEVQMTLNSSLKGDAGIDLSTDGKRLAICGDRLFEIWDLRAGRLLLRQQAHRDAISCVIFSPDRRLIATTSIDNTAKIWSAESGQELATLSGHREGIVRGAFSPDGRTLATACSDGTVKLWNVLTGREILSLKPLSLVWHVGFSPDGRALVCAPGVGPLKLLRAPSPQEIERFESDRGRPNWQ